MRGRRGFQGFMRSERARGITEGGGRDNGSLRAPLRAQPVQWDLGTHISHNGTEREGGSGTAGGRRGSHSLIDSETQRLFFTYRTSRKNHEITTRRGVTYSFCSNPLSLFLFLVTCKLVILVTCNWKSLSLVDQLPLGVARASPHTWAPGGVLNTVPCGDGGV